MTAYIIIIIIIIVVVVVVVVIVIILPSVNILSIVIVNLVK